MNALKILLLLLLTALLSGCGFHFRQENSLPPTLHFIYIDNTQSDTGLTSELTQILQGMNVHTVKNKQSVPVRLVITQDHFTQTQNLIGSAQQLNSGMLSYTVTILLQNKVGKNITTPVTLSTSVSYWQSANQILGDTTALPALKQNLVHTMTAKILAYLNADDTRQALSHDQ